MKYVIIILLILYVLVWFIAPKITNKLGVSNKIYLNKSFTKLKAKYFGYIILIFSIILAASYYLNSNVVDFYTIMIQVIAFILFSITLIFRNDFLNLKYSDDMYYLDFVNVAVIPIILITLLSIILGMGSNLFMILVMIVIFIEYIILIFSLFPDKIHEYLKSRNFTFNYKQYFLIIMVLSLIPILILFPVIMLLSYVL